uniref:Uncharacterized protein n=1 Tax=Rhizophora mucronata TaxID=61149 RepID=A0A2P2QP47_RHIMU
MHSITSYDPQTYASIPLTRPRICMQIRRKLENLGAPVISFKMIKMMKKLSIT